MISQIAVLLTFSMRHYHYIAYILNQTLNHYIADFLYQLKLLYWRFQYQPTIIWLAMWTEKKIIMALKFHVIPDCNTADLRCQRWRPMDNRLHVVILGALSMFRVSVDMPLTFNIKSSIIILLIFNIISKNCIAFQYQPTFSWHFNVTRNDHVSGPQS